MASLMIGFTRSGGVQASGRAAELVVGGAVLLLPARSRRVHRRLSAWIGPVLCR